jgi:hypothetical protein
MTVHEALKAVMGQVQKIGKEDRNKDQGYRFRGIDAVINEVGPALREHGVLVIPEGDEITSEHYDTRKGARMRSVTMRVRWKIYGPEGDFIESATYGEAADAGDKAVSKAHAVAWRTVLLQALCIPTGDPDPDATTYERAVQPAGSPTQMLAPDVVQGRQGLYDDWVEKFGKWDQNSAEQLYGALTKGGVLTDADGDELRKFRAYVTNLPIDTDLDAPSLVDTPRTVSDKTPEEKALINMILRLKERFGDDRAEHLRFIKSVLNREVKSRGQTSLAERRAVVTALKSSAGDETDSRPSIVPAEES